MGPSCSEIFDGDTSFATEQVSDIVRLAWLRNPDSISPKPIKANQRTRPIFEANVEPDEDSCQALQTWTIKHTGSVAAWIMPKLTKSERMATANLGFSLGDTAIEPDAESLKVNSDTNTYAPSGQWVGE